MSIVILKIIILRFRSSRLSRPTSAGLQKIQGKVLYSVTPDGQFKKQILPISPRPWSPQTQKEARSHRPNSPYTQHVECMRRPISAYTHNLDSLDRPMSLYTQNVRSTQRPTSAYTQNVGDSHRPWSPYSHGASRLNNIKVKHGQS